MCPSILEDEQMQFGAITFFARQHKGETCGSNGLPLTPNSITILGRSQILKTIKHPLICQYLDVIRGKHERTIVVSQYCGQPLKKDGTLYKLPPERIARIAYQIISALQFLHRNGIVHRDLSTENILIQQNGDVKLFNYGLYYMTNEGKCVSFPIGQLLYTAPEVYLSGPDAPSCGPKGDVWALGMVLAELTLGIPLWNTLKLGQSIRKVLSLLHCNTSIFERIAREHNCYEKYESLPTDVLQLVEDCLKISPKDRLSADELLAKNIFKPFIENKHEEVSKYRPWEKYTLTELYYWWQLAGGDVYGELKKNGLIRSSPPILSLPNLVLIEGVSLGEKRNYATLYDPKVVPMPLESLYNRLKHLSIKCYYPLIHTTSEVILKEEPERYDASQFPLVIRERDPEYQFHRVTLFRRLLHGYPHNRDRIIQEAKIDIPPLLRGEIWAALLGVMGNYEEEYCRTDKETPTATDRQIEVDIPRCHQYNDLLSSSEGHRKLKRVLKAWIARNSQYVYWQGLDSLTAPFLYLHFTNEACAFACLSAFVPKYLHKFFLKDNSPIIQEYLAKFSQLIAFHDPELANHLRSINFIPELFAIPWFLTMFSHVFPLHKILHLWDKLLLGDASFPLHVGLAVLGQLRETLLSSGFNECILLFSDLPEVDMEQCVTVSLETYKTTPRSITSRVYQNKPEPLTELDISGITLDELSKEYCPRISASDLIFLLRNTPDDIVVVDIRSPNHFSRIAVNGSINVPFSSVKLGEKDLDSLGFQAGTLKNNTSKTVIIVDSEDTNAPLFSEYLVKCGVAKVCHLHGGINVLHSVTPSILISQRHM